MKLYRIETNKFSSYVLAETTTEAENKFIGWLNKEDYGFSEDRIFKSATLIADSEQHGLYDGMLILNNKLFL